jgi:hypothetical protein
MKVVCINNLELSKDSYGKPRYKRIPLTIGQIYEVMSNGIFGFPGKAEFYVIDNNNEEEFYPSRYFVTIDEWREIQLNKII